MPNMKKLFEELREAQAAYAQARTETYIVSKVIDDAAWNTYLSIKALTYKEDQTIRGKVYAVFELAIAAYRKHEITHDAYVAILNDCRKGIKNSCLAMKQMRDTGYVTYMTVRNSQKSYRVQMQAVARDIYEAVQEKYIAAVKIIKAAKAVQYAYDDYIYFSARAAVA